MRFFGHRNAITFITFLLLSLAGCSKAALPTCTPEGGIETVLAYPAPNSTGIPGNLGFVAFASSSSLQPGVFGANIVDNATGASVNFEGLTDFPGTLPSPSATPPFSNAFYQESINPGVVLPSGHIMTVYLYGQQCSAKAPYGSFTVR